MADCPYARCIQERRHIRRELLRWTKNMVFVVGLERVAEELMGRRKWKQYQDTLYSSTRSESATQPHHRLYPTLSTTCSLGTGSVSQVGHRQASSGLAQSTTPPLTAATPEPIVAKQPQQINNHKAEDECRVKLEPIDDTKSIGLSLTALSGRRRPRQGDADDEEENGHSDPEILEKRLKLDEEAQQITLIINENDKCVKEEPAEAQDIKEEPQEENCGEEVTKGNLNKSTKESEVCSTVAFTVHRRVSPPPEDWKPLDKCYLCLDGKLPHDDQPPLSPQSESSSSSRSAESPMSVQVDPMAASVVAAALSGTYPTLLPQWGLHARETALAGVQGHQESGPSVDQPLDLSAKPKNSQDNNISMMEQQKIPLRMPTGIDPKSIFTSSYRAKPRLTGPGGVGGVPVPGGGRRTYTEEELQAALRDIQSGKLGTRRAAVIYGIPRSTLRNKVYKLALERERDASLTSTQSHPHDSGAPASTTITTTTTSTTTTTTPNTTQNASTTTPPPQVDEADDRELSGAEEEKEVEKALLRPLLSLEDLVRFSALEPGGGDALRSLLQRGQETGTEWPGFEHANIGPYIQKMLAAAAPFKGLETQDYRIPEVMRRLMSEDKRLNKSVNGDQGHPSHQQTSTPSLQQRVPMTNDDFNPSIEEEASDSGQGRAILKIPSYKPASTPGSSKNNGEPTSAAFAQSFAATSSATTASPGLLERASPVFSGTSSPTNSLVGKTVGVNFRDVIAKSISSKFQESQSSLPNQTAMSGQNTSAGMISDSNLFKRGRYTPPQPQSQGATSQQATKSSSSSSSQDNKNKAPGSGGKGTRPKRGKYRNYDRDSLVEAVRAVQRGEMSVHRAGSYFGVPHSTLEYKVKERHLMRPRKRDQKPPEDKAKETPATSTSMRPGMQDKKSTLKPQKPFTSGAGTMPGPNGLKMPPFLEGMPHLPFPHPFNFWSPTPFMPSPFIPGAPNVPTMLPEQYFATQRMRGLQEQQRSAIVQPQHQQRDRDSIPPSAEQPGTSNSRSSKQAMDVSDGPYDASDANGSLLDILIRSRLDTNISRDQRAPMTEGRSQSTAHHDSMSSKALIDHLCRNSRRTPLPRMTQDSSEDESYRGPSSRSLPDRPERVPTVDLSPSPDRARADDGCERLTSPATPLSRTTSRDEDSRPDRESEIHNGGQQDDRKGLSLQPQLNHYADIHYSVTEKKSACDSKLIVDHSSQKTQQQELAAVSGLVVQLQRGYSTGANNRTSEQIQLNSQSTSQPVPESRSAVLTMEDSVE